MGLIKRPVVGALTGVENVCNWARSGTTTTGPGSDCPLFTTVARDTDKIGKLARCQRSLTFRSSEGRTLIVKSSHMFRSKHAAWSLLMRAFALLVTSVALLTPDAFGIYRVQ